MDINQPYPSPDSEENKNEENSAQGALEPILEPQTEEAQSLPQSQDEALTVTEGEGEAGAGQPLQEAEAQPSGEDRGSSSLRKIEEEPAVEEEVLPPVIEEEKPPLPKEESRISRFFRKALQWIIIGLVPGCRGSHPGLFPGSPACQAGIRQHPDRASNRPGKIYPGRKQPGSCAKRTGKHENRAAEKPGGPASIHQPGGIFEGDEQYQYRTLCAG